MALRLFVVVIVLLLLSMVPHLPKWRRLEWFDQWVGHLSDSSGAARVLVCVLPPLAACALIAFILSRTPYLAVLWVVFAAAVLAYSFGPRELEADIDAVLAAPDAASRHDAAQALRPGIDDEPLPMLAPAWVEATVVSALWRRFGVLFWFLLAGPTGAIGYRLVQLLAAGQPATRLDAATRAAARRTLEVLDWLPSHLMVFAMALVSDFDAVVQAWRAWHREPGRAARPFEAGFLGAVARAGVDADVEAGDGYAEDTSDPAGELTDTRHLLTRVLMVWLAVTALLVLADWII
ncbi:cobalamin biosynthesis protein [Oleiagrimonas sp. C23AA]|uniref:cobalamin biosynthesis protein n=1 Tax=Oleiagrimonas sp. C23AA TaxID=2719047 RepID=UPI00142167AC|nr:cobalamin biosynthesis protein [Oleiagrimonas sp. C23AA]NII10839.1 beta-lactamase induction protein [Oleiagrimonas sp. C23AA]